MRERLAQQVAALGPFFVVEAHVAGAEPVRPWRRMRELVDDKQAMGARVHHVRDALATFAERPPDTVELRVAASVAHLGLVARLLSPMLAAAVIADVVPDIRLEAAWWQPVLGQPYPLSLPDAAPGDSSTVKEMIEGPVTTLTEAVRAVATVSPQVLWGNVTSAVNSAIELVEAQRPDTSAKARALSEALLAQPPLRGTAVVTENGFRRRSCCLIYRAAPGAAGSTCGDCVLNASDDRRATPHAAG